MINRLILAGAILIGVAMIGLALLLTAGDDDTSLDPTRISISKVPEDVLAQGKAAYELHCAACHGINGEGQTPAKPLERDETGRFPAPPHNSTGHTWHHDDMLIKRIIREGGMGDENFYEMPAFPHLSDQEIDAILAYIKTMWTEEQRQMQAERTALVQAEEE